MVKSGDILIAHSTDTGTRHNATSGGIGSAIIYYLFNTQRIKSTISFKYQPENLEYAPYIINDINDYNVSGSIYHEISLVKFIKENISKIEPPFACFALPCQVTPILNLLEKANIKAYVFELTCSSQQSIEATQYLVKRAGISPNEILNIKYRGGGWPGGIRITTKDKKEIFYHNNNSLWTKIFHSHLFIQPRCFFCGTDKGTNSDIQLADPWGIDSLNSQTDGRSMCYIKSGRIAAILTEMHDKGLISYEKSDKQNFIRSQAGTLIRKNYNLKHKRFTKFIKAIIQHPLYKKVVLSSNILFTAHCCLYKGMYRILHKISSF